MSKLSKFLCQLLLVLTYFPAQGRIVLICQFYVVARPKQTWVERRATPNYDFYVGRPEQPAKNKPGWSVAACKDEVLP